MTSRMKYICMTANRKRKLYKVDQNKFIAFYSLSDDSNTEKTTKTNAAKILSSNLLLYIEFKKFIETIAVVNEQFRQLTDTLDKVLWIPAFPKTKNKFFFRNIKQTLAHKIIKLSVRNITRQQQLLPLILAQHWFDILISAK